MSQRILFLYAILGFLFAWQPAIAANGRLEINQACVADGCFPGDTADFPVEITNPGSYVFTSDVHSDTSGDNGIWIQTSDVTLDLNGFTLSGAGTIAGEGVVVGGDRAEIRNGRISGFGLGITPEDTSLHALHSRAIGLTISAPGIWAIRLNEHSQVKECTITTSGNGVVVSNNSRVIGNDIESDSKATIEHGITFVSGDLGIVRDNLVQNAGGYGIKGGYLIDSNVVFGSGLSGINISSRTIVRGNTITNSQQYGIEIDGTNDFIHHNDITNSNLSGMAFTPIEACPTCEIVDNHTP